MSIRIGKFVIIPMEPDHIPGADVWVRDEETGEGMGTTMEKLEKILDQFWKDEF